MSQPLSGTFTDQDIEAVRRGFATDHGRYIALMDLSNFLANDNMDALLPAAEVVLNRPIMPGPINPSMVEFSTTSRALELESLAPPAPPLPRMMKNLLKDRRRFQRQFVTCAGPPIPEFDQEVVFAAHKAVENYQLKAMFKQEAKAKPNKKTRAFASELLFSSIASKDMTGSACIKPEMEFKLVKKDVEK